MHICICLLANLVLVLWFEEDIGVVKDVGGPGGVELEFPEQYHVRNTYAYNVYLLDNGLVFPL